jgi:heptaprenyl diphosphate synthase
MDLAPATGGPDEPAGRADDSPIQSFWADVPVVRDDLAAVQRVIHGTAEDASAGIRSSLSSTLENTGKMLRPALVLLAARAGRYRRERRKGAAKTRPTGRSRVGRGSVRDRGTVAGKLQTPRSFRDQAPEKIYRIAGAVEILHMATLIHDDVIDVAESRRGRPAAHVVEGNKRAVLMGDLLFSSCFSLLAEDATMANAQLLARGVQHICESQIDESVPAETGPRTPREYSRQVAAKTALLFALSCHVGASESGVIESDAQVLRRYGYNLGMAFQVIDDLLDLTGSEAELGKPVGTDLKSGLRTLPVIYALQNDDGRLQQHLDAGVGDAEVPTVVSLIRERGGIRRARETAERYTARGHHELSRLHPSPVRDTLSRLLDLSLERRG